MKEVFAQKPNIERKRKLCLKRKDERLLRRQLERYKPAAPICQKISSKGCFGTTPTLKSLTDKPRWKSWPEEDDVFK